MSTGSIVTNFHEGSRSEYLAQYVLAGMGTAVAVDHHEDAGIDVFCTITERVGGRSWPRQHFTVQVKSNDDPWTFDGELSVRWLLEHPLPLFLCIVDKPTARLRFYQTSQRFQSGLLSPRPTQVRLQPQLTVEGKTFEWTPPGDFSLSAPIVDRTIMDLLDVKCVANARECLMAWAAIDAKNIHRRASGLKAVQLPSEYTTNAPPHETGTSTMIGPDHDALPTLIEIVEHLAVAKRDDADKTTITLLNMLHRHLTRQDKSKIPFVNNVINKQMGLGDGYLFEGVDRLIDDVRRALR